MAVFVRMYAIVPLLFAATVAASAGGAIDVVAHIVQHSLRRGILCVLLHYSPGLPM